MSEENQNVSGDNRIRHEIEYGSITVERVYESDYQKEGTLTAQLRQEVTRKSFYPSKTVSNEMNDSVFSTDDFGFEEQEYTSPESRVAWILVPMGTKASDVQAKINALSNAVLYRVLDSKPIVTQDQQYAIDAGRITREQLAMTQAIRYPEDDDKADQLILDNNGNVQYRKVFFSKNGKSDQDNRSSDRVWVSEELKRELESMKEGSEPEVTLDENQEVV